MSLRVWVGVCGHGGVCRLGIADGVFTAKLKRVAFPLMIVSEVEQDLIP